MDSDISYMDFVKTFDIAENALSMRSLRRWNGRDLPHEENLSEHTHLVVACTIKLYDDFCLRGKARFETVVKLAMIHDSLEMYRGDILSITKDSVPGLRAYIDKEEQDFQSTIVNPTWFETNLVNLADLMARFMFIENELKKSTNEFTYKAYESSKSLYYSKYMNFITDNNLSDIYKISDELPEYNKEPLNKFAKGYKDDAGIDVILDNPVVFLPHCTIKVDLNVICTPNEGEMAVLCARTSAAAKGLSVAMCPIDPNYCGTVTAIVHNISNNIVRYNKGEAFCQLVYIKLADETILYDVKKSGKRSTGKLGSTGC